MLFSQLVGDIAKQHLLRPVLDGSIDIGTQWWRVGEAESVTGSIGGVEIEYHVWIPHLPDSSQYATHLGRIRFEAITIEIEPVIVGTSTDRVGSILVTSLTQSWSQCLVAVDVVDRDAHDHQIRQPQRVLAAASISEYRQCRFFPLHLATMDVGLQVDHGSPRSTCLVSVDTGRIGEHHQRDVTPPGALSQGRDDDGSALALQFGDERVHIRQRRGLFGIAQLCPCPRAFRLRSEIVDRLATEGERE